MTQIKRCSAFFALLLATSALAQPMPQSKQQLPIKDVQRFSSAISQIKNFYVKDTKDQKLFEDAIRGMLAGLDPHSSYLNAEEFKELQETTNGEFAGLGLEVTLEDGLIKVVSPIDDSPAAKAGIQAGDLIVRLNQEPVRGMALSDAVKKMRGKPGTSITLTIIRKNLNKPLILKMERAQIKVTSIKSELFDKHYGYIRVSHFQSNSAPELEKAVVKLRQDAKNRLYGLVLDLRNNPGGLLDAAVQISDAFLDVKKQDSSDVIVYTEGRLPGSKFIANAKPGDLMQGAPIVILINGGSASGSEIVAGALQDHKRALVAGTKSFGKGSVQTVLPLDDKTGLKLTTALYYTPSGRSIQAKGIEPDIVIESVQFPEAKADKEDAFDLSEADLSQHLEVNQEATPSTEESSTTKPKQQALVQKDFQLYEALNLLKSMHLLENRKVKS